MVHGEARLLVLLMGIVFIGGCAARHSSPLTNRLVRTGKPAVDLGGPPLAVSGSVKAKLSHARPAGVDASQRQTSFGTTVEGTNPRLASALLAAAVFPTAESQVKVAEEYKSLHIMDAAYTALDRALQKSPFLSVAHESLARVWRDWGMPEQGLGPAYRAVYYAPGSASAQNTLGTMFDALGRAADARAAFERALELDPSASWALNNLCYVDFKLGLLEQARAQCAAALRLAPGFTAAHNNMGLIHAAAGEFAEARRSFLEGGGEAAADFNLGIVYLRANDYASAADAFEEAIKARPDFTAAKTRAHAARVRVITGRN